MKEEIRNDKCANCGKGSPEVYAAWLKKYVCIECNIKRIKKEYGFYVK